MYLSERPSLLLRALFRGKVEQLVRLSYDAFSTRGAAQTLKCLGHADYFFDDNRQNGIKRAWPPASHDLTSAGYALGGHLDSD